MGLKDLMKIATDEATDLVKRELEKKELEKKQLQRVSQHTSSPLFIKNGSLGITGHCVMRQRPEDELVYFNMDESILYELIEYSWNGPIYASTSKSNTSTVNNSETTKKGKSGKMAAGALIGTVLMPGIGTVVGAAIGASGKSKTSGKASGSSTSESITQKIEQPGVAILKFRNIDTGNIIPITVTCTSEIDAKIRCFQIKHPQSASEVSKNTADALKGIKALKELLDMGAISEEEFEAKKKEILNL